MAISSIGGGSSPQPSPEVEASAKAGQRQPAPEEPAVRGISARFRDRRQTRRQRRDRRREAFKALFNRQDIPNGFDLRDHHAEEAIEIIDEVMVQNEQYDDESLDEYKARLESSLAELIDWKELIKILGPIIAKWIINIVVERLMNEGRAQATRRRTANSQAPTMRPASPPRPRLRRRS